MKVEEELAMNWFNQKSNNKQLSLADEDLSKESPDYFLSGDLSSENTKAIDSLLVTPLESKMGIKSVFQKSAEAVGRSWRNIELYAPQVDPVIMSYLNPRLFIGDSPGLGKTIISAGSYAYYRLRQIKAGLPYGKVLVVTETIHVLKFAKEWESAGIKLLPLYGGNAKIKSILKKESVEDYDGVILNWDSLKTNEFIEFWIFNKALFDSSVFDETSCLRSEKSQLYKTVNAIVNNYLGGIKRVLFLNGTPFEKDLYDVYYQMGILKPKLIPSKAFLDRRYIVKEGETIYTSQFNSSGVREMVAHRTGKIVDYKNQEEFKERLKYYYIARRKEDYSTDSPKHSYILHLVPMTTAQKELMAKSKTISLINSPTTSDSTAVLDSRTSLKFKEVMDFIPKVDNDRPLIYVENIESQRIISEELVKMGYRTVIVNGTTTIDEQFARISAFENYEYDIMVFNKQKAMSIKTSERIIFYDVPSMPQETTQIKARIDRDNYSVGKFYDFFAFAKSPEEVHIWELGFFREKHSNAFTGKSEQVYEQLVHQLINVYDSELAHTVGSLITENQASENSFKTIENQVEDLLDI